MLRNHGHGIGHGTWAQLVSLDQYVTVLHDSIGYGEVAPLGSVTANDSFMVSVTTSCPFGYRAMMRLHVVADRCSESDTFYLLVGPSGFSDDMESGESQWTHGGVDDRWHLSTYRAHSGGRSWYCGEEGTQRYSSNMNAWLTTVPLVVAENCSLSFWRWFKVPNYGVDGIYVVVARGSREDTLDFVGTGGALGDPLDVIESDWAQEHYDLSWLVPGETIQVKLSFKSDGDTIDEGFYIDDVVISGGMPPVLGVTAQEPARMREPLVVTPNPFRTRTVIRSAVTRGMGEIGVYDAAGRQVRVLATVNGRTVWDGRDRHGLGLPEGAYFVRSAGTAAPATVRVVLVR
jgi:hypothetical protein